MERRTIDLVHSIFCRKPHTHRIEALSVPFRESSICYYYLEDQVEHGENMEDHLVLAKKTQDMMRILGVLSDDEVVKFMQSLSNVVAKASILEFEFPGAKEILKEALGF